jgi:hypothetical protein
MRAANHLGLLAAIAVPVLCVFCLLLHGAAASAAQALCRDAWDALLPHALGAGEHTIAERIGNPDARAYDVLLDADVAAYRLSGEAAAPREGRVYYRNGIAVAVATIYDNERSGGLLPRFLLEHADEILDYGDRSAVAGLRENCDVYTVLSVGDRESGVYILNAAFYRKMAALGDLPSLPPDHGRKGHAA